jgi:flagellar hook-associated protein 3 FlgL
MRVSNKMMADSIKTNLFRQAEQLYKTQERIVSGKRINRPSDDPIGVGEVLNYRKTISSLGQYQDNITKANMHIDTTEQILDTVTEMLYEAKDIASDPNVEMRDTFAEEVATIRDQVIQMANSRINGNYIFAGDLTDTQPYDATGVYAGDTGSKTFMVGDGIEIDLEADGSRVFQGGSDVFTVLSDLETALLAGDATAINNQIVPLNDAIEQINTVRVENAGRHKRLEATDTHYENFKFNVEELLSHVEDADIAEAIIDLQVQQVAYESTMATSAKMITPSLIDFLN